ncbi:hypothetical protein AVKW3434_04325 [Acidovorax sp. SUPP3434]|uniref:hypothetical protein n=1 Tax=Acidovorax sp. SUPP3434 TaxID=2920880 RepID=UPI0023DE5470|nr:hypothetical protein [Acidovorax sp. SUPP3434]GKS98575.1 hypothetical protein AVKW3434_04325 [Acidovorax sp. SUPP3434]
MYFGCGAEGFLVSASEHWKACRSLPGGQRIAFSLQLQRTGFGISGTLLQAVLMKKPQFKAENFAE